MKQAEIQKKQLNELVLWDKNPRAIKEVDYERLKNLIKELGLFKPFVINQDNIILGGNMRYRVCKDLGYKEVFVSVVKTNNEAEMFSYALADNDRAGYYEEDKVAELVLQNPTLKLDLHKLDLGQQTSIEEILERFGPSLEEDEPPELEEGEAISKLGEVYQLGRHRVMCGDATKIADVEKLMDGNRADMVFTDPPYNVDYHGGMHADGSQSIRKKIKNDKMSTDSFYNFLYTVMKNLISIVDGAFYVCMSSSELHTLWKAFTDAGGHWQTYIIWAKDAFTLSRSDYQHQFEPIMHGLTDSAIERAINEIDEDKLPIMYGWTKHNWYGGRKQGDVWRFDRPRISKEHPTMKPIALCAKAIVNSSERDEIVLDVFGGSGSTLIACEQKKRTCYMMELDEHYVDVIRKRYHKFITGSEEGWEINTPKLNV